MNYKFFIYFCIVVTLISCQKNKSQSTQTKLLGHAGAGMKQWNGMYHNNSLESIKYAFSLDNCSGVEVDIQISQDTTFWLFHDFNLSSSTNSTGCIAQSSDLQLQSTHYNTIHKERLTTLNQILELSSQKEIVLDLKHFNACDNGVVNYQFIKRGFEKLGTIPANVKIKMNSIALYSSLKDLNCSLILELETANEVSQANNKPEIKGLMFNASKINKDAIQNLQSKGFIVYLYEVRSVARLKTELKKKPDFILVDDLINSMLEL